MRDATLLGNIKELVGVFTARRSTLAALKDRRDDVETILRRRSPPLPPSLLDGWESLNRQINEAEEGASDDTFVYELLDLIDKHNGEGSATA